MKNTMKRMAALGVSAALAAGLLAGCGGAPAGGSAPSGDGDITTLTWYMSINPVAADTDKVIQALNEYTREKIGATGPPITCSSPARTRSWTSPNCCPSTPRKPGSSSPRPSGTPSA